MGPKRIKRSGKWRTKTEALENAGLENARLEITGTKCMSGKCAHPNSGHILRFPINSVNPNNGLKYAQPAEFQKKIKTRLRRLNIAIECWTAKPTFLMKSSAVAL